MRSAQTYQNKKRYYDISPAVESAFSRTRSPPAGSSPFSRQIIYTDVVYQEMTIYDKTAEKLWSYRLSLPGSIKETWGTFYSNISWQQYCHDASVYRLPLPRRSSSGCQGALARRVGASYDRLHDQIDQPRRSLRTRRYCST